MSVLVLAMLLLGSCGTAPLPQRLEDACDARVCPSDPPDYINCMPIVDPDWAPICSTSCRQFLHDTCKIQFVD